MPPDFVPPEPVPGTYVPLLPPKSKAVQSRHTLVLDLDETLVHSSFVPVPNPDHEVSIFVEGAVYPVYIKCRPYLQQFLSRVSELFEVYCERIRRERFEGGPQGCASCLVWGRKRVCVPETGLSLLALYWHFIAASHPYSRLQGPAATARPDSHA